MAEEGKNETIITDSSNAAMDDNSNATSEPTKKNVIHFSNTKMPFVFYLNLAKKYMKQYNDVELSALGMAIPTVVVISEILKGNGVAAQKSISISTVKTKDESNGKLIQKAKIEIMMERMEKSDKPKADATTSTKDAAQHEVDLHTESTETGTEKTEGNSVKIVTAEAEKK